VTIALWGSDVLPEIPTASDSGRSRERAEGKGERDDAALVAAFRLGDAAAFETLYRRQVGRLYGLAHRLTSRPAEAEELTQEAFVRAWDHRVTFESCEHLARWLRRVVVNCWINDLRRRKRRAAGGPAVDFDAELDADLAEAAVPPAPPGLKLDLERALGALSPRLRAVVALFDLYGCGHDEIAELLDITPGASKVQLHRARTRLREMLR
jgi:RNA polymerase sigma-70 factor (ECF subfamily)